MTDNEIIKALKCCGNIVDSTCKECVYHETYNASCVVRLMRDALGLINRQKAEIAELQRRIVFWREDLNYQPEIERAEAIKEFAERLCNGRVSNDPVVIAVKAELKEMCGE